MKKLLAILFALAAAATPLTAQDVIRFKDPKTADRTWKATSPA
jgi:hypothetical protein